MCGIGGGVSFNKKSFKDRTEEFEAMSKTLTRRGPDEFGLFSSDEAILVHRRLVVIDKEGGRQPMIENVNGTEYVLVYNGELYNTASLRNELEAKGYTFNSYSDTEVVLKSCICWGEDAPKHLEGIFAFALWQPKTKKLFLARDIMGVKPLFYTVKGDTLYFSSEIKGLLALNDVDAVIDSEGLGEIFLLGPGRTPGCGILKGIREMKPGYCGVFDINGLHLKRYWKLVAKEHTDDFSTTVATVKELVYSAIKRQLVSDVPIGTYLSGGLDSSIISSVANRVLGERGEKLLTFSVDYVDNEKYFKTSHFQPNSDNAFIDIMIKYLDCANHRTIINTEQLVKGIFNAVDARDLPGMGDVDSSMLIFCNAISKDVTVALSGECADEIFGGYPWFRDENIRAIDGFPWSQSIGYRLSFLHEDIANATGGADYVYEKYKATLADTDCLQEDTPLAKRMREMMRLNTDWFMANLLDRKDRMSMYSSLEVRVPYCDRAIAEYLYNVPWEMKEYQGKEKGLLREAMKDFLPDEVYSRKKSPYPKTHHPEYRKAVGTLLKEVIQDDNSPLLNLVRREALAGLLVDDQQTPWYGQLMTTPQTIAYFLQINYWLKKYNVKVTL